jgi:diguanylate cyclase
MDDLRRRPAGAEPLVPLNRAEFQQRMEVEASRVNRHGGELGLIVFSIDNLREMYAHLGRRAGDDVIDHLSAHVGRRIRTHDLLGRRSGGEFAVLVPAMDLSDVTGFAVKLRRLVMEYQLNGAPLLTASFGVTEFQRGEATAILEQRALRALERAQQAGGNRVSAARAGG